MPTDSMAEATERLARAVENASRADPEIFYDEMFPEEPIPSPLRAEVIARYIRNEVAPDEAIDFWHVVFPQDRNIWYGEEEKVIHVNGEAPRYMG